MVNSIKYWKTLQFKIIFVLGIILMVIFAGLVISNFHLYNKEMIKTLSDDADHLNSSLVSSLEHSMLSGNRNDIQTSINIISQDDHIEGLFITDNFGIIRVASDTNLIGTRFNIKSSSVQTHGASDTKVQNNTFILNDKDGSRILRSVKPIYNKKACYRCHDPGISVNGVFFLDYSLESYESQLSIYKWKAIFWGTMALFVVFGVTFIVLDKLVITRIKRLIQRLQSISSGNFSVGAIPKGSDEFAMLDFSISQMSTNIKTSIRKISRHRDYLQNVINSVQDGLVVVDKKYRIVMANETFLKFIGTDSSNVVGFSCSMVLGKGMCSGNVHGKCPSASVFKSGHTSHQTHMFHEKNVQKVLEISASPLYDQNGKVIQSIEIIRDITEKTNVENELIQSEKMALIGRLAAGVAHEINNPLGTISTCTEGLLNRFEHKENSQPIVEPWYIDNLKRIENCIFRCKNIIQRLLDFSHSDMGIMETLDLNPVIENTVQLALHRARAEQKAITLSLLSPKALIKGQPTQLSQLILNLLINSLDAVSQGGKIKISTHQRDTMICLIVEDDGIGIDEKHINTVFEPFFTTKDVGKGTGLGLSICKRIVKEHRGTIQIKSVKGIGCKIEILFPGIKNKELKTSKDRTFDAK